MNKILSKIKDKLNNFVNYCKNNKVQSALLFLIYLSICCFIFVKLLPKMFYIHNFEQILFHLNQPLDGVDQELINKIISRILRHSIVYFLVFLFIFKLFRLGFKGAGKILFLTVCAIVIFAFTICYSFKIFKINDYLKRQDKETPFSNYYEENYVFPNSQNVKFNKKKNLIILYLESVENSYYKKTGLFKENLLPNLENLAKTEISFNGFKQVSGTSWTIAGLFASNCGVPLKSVVNGVSYRNIKDFFKNIKCLPQILKSNGYKTYYLQGADIKFAGKNKFFSQHGVDNPLGKNYFMNLEGYNKSQDGDWGINDHTLFRHAQEKISEIAKNKSQPFMFTMLTVDTHHTTGFLNSVCERKYDIDMKNTLHCQDKLIFNFISWLKKQDFYDNTTILIVGDHLAMPNTLRSYLDRNKNRQIINIFINSDKKTQNLNRQFTTFDLFPTILESIGADAKRLGLGRSLFSENKTLIEKEGRKKFDRKICQKSQLYESFR